MFIVASLSLLVVAMTATIIWHLYTGVITWTSMGVVGNRRVAPLGYWWILSIEIAGTAYIGHVLFNLL